MTRRYAVVGLSPLARRLRHEPGHALRARRTDRGRPERALPQMSLVKKSTGRLSALAEDSTIPHRVASALSVSGPASALAGLPFRQNTSAASAIAFPMAPVKPRMRHASCMPLPAKAPML